MTYESKTVIGHCFVGYFAFKGWTSLVYLILQYSIFAMLHRPLVVEMSYWTEETAEIQAYDALLVTGWLKIFLCTLWFTKNMYNVGQEMEMSC